MKWIEMDPFAALDAARQAAAAPDTQKTPCLEWKWDAGRAYYREREEDHAAFGREKIAVSILPGEAEYEYAVYVPPGGSEGKPMILFLHGFGERGGDPRALLQYGPFRFLAQGGTVPAVIIAPHLEENRHWVEDERGALSDAEMDRLARFLAQMQARYHPDPGNISCTGLSMGGRAVYRLNCFLPGVFSAAAICCGRAGDEQGVSEPLERMANRRVWLFHGLKDKIVPSRRALEALEELLRFRPQGQFRLTLYPKMGHSCYDSAYLNGELYRWLMER